MRPPVFMTGATGFLGMEVLARLLEAGDREVVCLVRATDRAAAEARLDDVLAKLWTDPSPSRSAAIVIFQPGSLDVRKLGDALTAERIICTTRGGDHNPGVRLAPHFYNTMDEIDRTVGAFRKYLAAGV